MSARGYCPECGLAVHTMGGRLLHDASKRYECNPAHEYGEHEVEDLEQQVLNAVVELVKWFRQYDEPLPAMLARPYMDVLDRGDALFEAYDPHWRASPRR